MVTVEIGKNEAGRRLDKFLRSYLNGAPLSLVYRMIRKDVRVSGKRRQADYILQDGDLLVLYLPEDTFTSLRRTETELPETLPRKTFRVAYENEDLLIADKPPGLLTHGDSREKKNHLTNQVKGYLLSTGAYDPAAEKTFSPAPVNRLDRNTSGLVIFAKNYDALRTMNELFRGHGAVRKIYTTIVCGRLDAPLELTGLMEKDEERNRSRETRAHGKFMRTVVRPVRTAVYQGRAFTLCTVEIFTGRTHQIRLQLSGAGFPILGDPKYGSAEENRFARVAFGQNVQLLHAGEYRFEQMPERFARLNGQTVRADVPKRFRAIRGKLFGYDENITE